jgi:CBS domain-containing protein
MTKAGEVMTQEVEHVEARSIVVSAAKRLAQQDYGERPVCVDGRLTGGVTDGDIVVKVMWRARTRTLCRSPNSPMARRSRSSPTTA